MSRITQLRQASLYDDGSVMRRMQELVDTLAWIRIELAPSSDAAASPNDATRRQRALVKMDTKGLTGFTRMTGDLVKAMRACPQPIVAAVEGICAGAGAIIAMASDIRVAANGAKVAFLFNKVGLAGCDMGACAILPRIIGQSRASELLYTGRFMTAEEGEKWGFFSRIVAPAEILVQAEGLAREIAEGPTFANTMTKRMLAMEWAMSVEEAIESEAIAQALCMTTADFTRAFEAFSRKEKPVFQGN